MPDGPDGHHQLTGVGLGAPWTDGDPALGVFPERAPATRRWCVADRLGPQPAAGCWGCLDGNPEPLAGDPRVPHPLQGLERLRDLPKVVEQERRCGTAAPGPSRDHSSHQSRTPLTG